MNFNNSIFKSNINIKIPQNCQVIFVSDIFVENYVGGAELTTEALIGSAPFEVYKLKSNDVTLDLLEQGHHKHWIFGNFANIKHELIPTIVGNLSYSILEYDFKYCRYRSPQKHKIIESVDCNCHNNMHGKMISAFFHGAKSIWWMSERQQQAYIEHFPFLQNNNQVVLSSVFGEAFWHQLKELKAKYADHDRKGWIVLGSPSWVKGAEAAIARCEEMGYEYESVWGLPYSELLEKLAQAEGFVYHPAGWDTCPRMVIEAQLLGCELDINENVLHKDEIWFKTEDPFDTEAYLYAARERFWRGIKTAWQWRPSISGYTTTLNVKRHGYPWIQSIESLLGFCDEVIVVDGGSTDGTWELLESWVADEPRLKIHKEKRNWQAKRFALYDGEQKALARSLCTMDICWQQDADEIVPEVDWPKIHVLAREFPTQVDLIALPVVEYWGSKEKTRLDVTPWKWRISRNKPNITHGIPSHLRKYDEDSLYAAPGTDGCDYIDSKTYQIIPHANFYHDEIHNVRISALSGDKKSLDVYTDWFKRNIETLPGVRHHSWLDLSRKIRTYRDYWSKHWQSLYDVEQEDTVENNMFFDKPWSEVTEKEIDELAERLAKETGGHVFHSKIDWSTPTPYLQLS